MLALALELPLIPYSKETAKQNNDADSDDKNLELFTQWRYRQWNSLLLQQLRKKV